MRGHCPELEHVVTLDGAGPDSISLDELRRRGRGVDAAELDRIAASTGPQDAATIVYTSGTTGPPKGCITTHANLMRTARMYERQIDLGPGSVVFMFLPLAHLLARVTQMVVLDVEGRSPTGVATPRCSLTIFAPCERRICRPFPACWRRSTRRR